VRELCSRFWRHVASAGRESGSRAAALHVAYLYFTFTMWVYLQFGGSMDLKGATPDWPHAPAHRLHDAGTHIVSAGTYNRAHHFHDAERLTYLT
jgi:hypothetical protein